MPHPLPKLPNNYDDRWTDGSITGIENELEVAIVRQIDTSSASAPSSPRARLVEPPDRCKICVLRGLGGIGKAQLAIEYARVHKAVYTSVFWIDGMTEDSLLQKTFNSKDTSPKWTDTRHRYSKSQWTKGVEGESTRSTTLVYSKRKYSVAFDLRQCR